MEVATLSVTSSSLSFTKKVLPMSGFISSIDSAKSPKSTRMSCSLSARSTTLAGAYVVRRVLRDVAQDDGVALREPHDRASHVASVINNDLVGCLEARRDERHVSREHAHNGQLSEHANRRKVVRVEV